MSDHSKITRRNFIKDAAIASAAAAAGSLASQAPASAAGLHDQPATPVIAAKELTCDVLVVGTGIAGLTTANRALDAGVKVIVIEKLPRGYWAPGGSMVVSLLGFAPPSSKEEDEVARVMTVTEGTSPPEMARAHAKNRILAYAYLTQKIGVQTEDKVGLRLKPARPYMEWGLIKPGAPYDTSRYGGKAAAELMEQRLVKGGVQVLYETKAEKLLTNAKREVVGVLARDKEGFFQINAQSTVLCTGSWVRDPEHIAKAITSSADQYINANICTPGETGDGHKMALEVDAKLRSVSSIYPTICPRPCAAIPYHDLLQFNWSLEYKEYDLSKGLYPDFLGIVVTDDGERVGDESLGKQWLGPVIVKKQRAALVGAFAYHIIDTTMYNILKPVLDRLVKQGGEVFSASTIEELAKTLKISAYLAVTVSEYNAAVRENRTERMRIPRTKSFTSVSGPKFEASQLSTPPFYAVPFVVGGPGENGAAVVVNPKAEVLDRDDKVIRGLYAAGYTMEGAVGGGTEKNAGGNIGGLAVGYTWGYIAGDSAASFAKNPAT